ncbi:hypothetical protein CLIB1423_24S00716 [[Candida] railenensis]|uniref:Zn(2)-C6 fungal-type domain-containing protein n=1 Tax=[Candida] railenensis TaxID=45579 RepID=A0A9P0W0R7_9ASCO|nr:hypothetical protein CLIB1423_24S00716 [[Candida] railenensis]
MEDTKEKKKIKRSRNGCHRCKKQKIKCDEKKPSCSYCLKSGIACDYSMKLTWGGRPFKNLDKRQTFAEDDAKPSKRKRSISKGSNVGVSFVVNTFDKNSKVTQETHLDTTPLKKSKSETYSDNDKDASNMVGATDMNRSISMPANNQNQIMSFNSPQEEDLLNALGNPTSTQNHQQHHLLGPLIQTPNTGTPGSPGDKFSLIEHFPGISDGIESLSHALESIASGGNQFNIKNSEIFNNFVLSNLEDKKEEESQPNIQSQVGQSPLRQEFKTIELKADPNQAVTPTSFTPIPTTGWDNLHLENYSADLSKIEQIMPHTKANFLEEFLSPASSSMFSRKVPASSVESSKERESPDNGSQLQNINPLDALNIIPPSMSPLPEILLQVPYYRDLFHFWITVASDHLVPAPSTMYHENPFKVILPRMAMESPSILTTILAFAESVRAQYDFSMNEAKVIIDQLLARSCTELLKLLQDKNKATSDATLATVLLLSCLEVFSCGNFDRHRAHTLGARQIILSRGLKISKNKKFKEVKNEQEIKLEDENVNSSLNKDSDSVTDKANEVKDIVGGSTSSKVAVTEDSYFSPGSTISSMYNDTLVDDDDDTSSESDVAYFLMRWFAYVDVIGAISATKHSENYLSHKQGEDLYHNNNGEQIEGYKSGHIDRLLGFDLIFLPLLADVALLIRQTNQYLLTSGSRSNMLPVSLISRALETKESLSSAFATGENKRQERLERVIRKANITKQRLEGPRCAPADTTNILRKDSILRSTNKIFFNMGLLNLYRRVLMVERKSSLIQDLCEEIGDILQLSIEPKSPAEICSIFCTFCAACESTNISMQQLFHARFTTLAEMGLTNAKKSLEIMERCWETGADWMYVANELDIDITLL